MAFTQTCLVLLVIFCLMAIGESKGWNGHRNGKKCGRERCHAGQECVKRKDGSRECVCRSTCKHHKNLVCGSDGRTYYNHCELHRIACIDGRKLSVKHDGHCRKKDTPPASAAQDEGDDSSYRSVCYEIERDELRQLLIDWLQKESREGKAYADVILGTFRSCDRNRDKQLDASELLECLEKKHMGNSKQDGEKRIHRGLCVDALISLGDKDENWVLNLEEFTRCMNPSYQPPRKECQLEQKKYQDGAETTVDCNLCICACGDWVCTGAPCVDGKQDTAVPGPVQRGAIPNAESRRKFLRDFRASDFIEIATAQNEVRMRRRAERIQNDLKRLNAHVRKP